MKLIKLFQEKASSLKSNLSKYSLKRPKLNEILVLMIGLIFAFLPFQIKKIFSTSDIFWTGKFNSFSTIFIYFTEILILLSLIFFALNLFIKKKEISVGNQKIFLFSLIFLIIAEISVLFSNNNTFSFILVFKLFVLFLFYLVLIQNLVQPFLVSKIIIYTSLFQSLVAILQYLKQGSTGLHFLGEPNISKFSEGLAKVNIGAEKIIRTYGTFDHPNILAGLLIMAILLSLFEFIRSKKYKYLIILFIQFIALILTFSRSSLLGLFIGLLIIFVIPEIKKKFNKKKIIIGGVGLLLVITLIFSSNIFRNRFLSFPTGSEVNERLNYIKIGKNVFLENPFGIGIGTFTGKMGEYSKNIILSPWNYQPIHNTYLLILAELGLQSLILMVLFYYFIIKEYWDTKNAFQTKEFIIFKKITASMFVAFSITMLFDHYIYTSFQGQLLAVTLLYFMNFSLEKRGNIWKI